MLDLLEIGYIFEHELNVTHILPNDFGKLSCVSNWLDTSLKTIDFSLICPQYGTSIHYETLLPEICKRKSTVLSYLTYAKRRFYYI